MEECNEYKEELMILLRAYEAKMDDLLEESETIFDNLVPKMKDLAELHEDYYKTRQDYIRLRQKLDMPLRQEEKQPSRFGFNMARLQVLNNEEF